LTEYRNRVPAGFARTATDAASPQAAEILLWWRGIGRFLKIVAPALVQAYRFSR